MTNLLHTLEIIEPIIFVLVIGILYLTKSSRMRPYLLIISALSTIVYCVWRIGFTLPNWNPWFLGAGLALLVTELLGFLELIPFYMVIWKDHKESTPRVLDGFTWPTVDIFIATYNEPADLLYKTVYACTQLEYPDKDKVTVYVCDDGNRPEIANLAKGLGVQYLARGTNKGAKAGNINYAFNHSAGETIITFDADMIPLSTFLVRTIPFMQDEKVGFVQVPQVFYNEDIFQYNTFLDTSIPNEQELFSQVIQAGRARFNAVIYAGSNTLFRREAIESVGGFLEDTITEDFATGMKIQARGWKSKYLNETLAVGLSPETFEDLINQRIRWGRGVLQTFKRHNPWREKGLNLSQRILYTSSLSYWFFGIYKFVYFTTPLLYGVLGWVVFTATPVSLLAIWLPSFLINKQVYSGIVGKFSSGFWKQAFDSALFPHIMKAMILELLAGKRDLKFKVTPKDRVQNHSIVFKSSLMMVQLIFLVLSVIAVLHTVFMVGEVAVHKQWLLLTNNAVSLFWVLYNMMQIVVAIAVANERPRLRSSDRFSFPAAVLIRRAKSGLPDIHATLQNISEGGLALSMKDLVVLPDGEPVELMLLPWFTHKRQEVIRVTGNLVVHERIADGYKAAFSFAHQSESERQGVIRYIYDRDDIVNRQSGFKVGFSGFISQYGRAVKSLNTRRGLARKAPRLSLSSLPAHIEMTFADMKGNSLSYVPLDVNSRFIRVESSSIAVPRARLNTRINSETYAITIELSKALENGGFLYEIVQESPRTIEQWLQCVNAGVAGQTETGLVNRKTS